MSRTDELKEKRLVLTSQIAQIQDQLGEKHRTDNTGRRLTSEEYWDWHRRAKYNLRERMDELRRLNLEIEREEGDKGSPLPGVVIRAYELLEGLSQEVSFDDNEKHVLEELRTLVGPKEKR